MEDLDRLNALHREQKVISTRCGFAGVELREPRDLILLSMPSRATKQQGMELAPESSMRLKFRALTASSHRSFARNDLF